MRRSVAAVWLVWLAVATLATPAAAAVTLRLEAKAEAAALRLAATNTGSEAALDVAPEVVYQRQTYQGDGVRLEPGSSHAWEFPLPAPAARGTFPATIRVRYADSAGAPRSTPVVALVSTPGAPASPVRARLTADPLSRVGGARLLLENPGPRPVAGRVVFVLPSVLHTEPESQPAEVGADGRSTVPLMLENGGAPAGTTLPLHAVFEYTAEGTHHTVLAETTVTVVTGAAAGRTLPLAIGLGALAITLGLLAAAWRTAARRQRSCL